jgi:hypothetical protein
MTIFKAFKLPTPEPIVYFNLRTGKDGNVTMIAVNAHGDKLSAGNILKITKDGKLSLSTCVSKELGLDLDTSGKIKLK